MKSSDYLPRRDRLFLQWVINFLSCLFPSLARFNFPDATYQDLAAKRNDFSTKLDVAEAPATRTKGSIDDKNVAKKSLVHAIREAVQRYLAHNPDVTQKDHDDLGLPNYKTTRTPIPPPTDLVELLLRQLAGHRVEVTFFPVSTNSTAKERREAKPYGVRGAELAWAVLPEPPKSLADLTHSAFDTRSPYMFQFDIPDAGKTLYVCARWENTTGQKGPWGDIQNAIIP